MFLGTYSPKLDEKGRIILPAKSAKTDSPADFRPIALGDADGKVFFTLLQQRLTKYMLGNEYISRSIQKGFIPHTPGCVDHATLLHGALYNARHHKRSICVSWLDLANAYGSVRHSLIRFALEYYHLPPSLVRLIMQYYDSLAAMVSTRDWSTSFFRYAIGVFQGCTLSTILFDIVFNLLYEFLKTCDVQPFVLKELTVTLRELLYADDLTFVTGGHYAARDNQRLIDRAGTWLGWTGTMRFKPAKCRSLALHYRGTYQPYDPRLKVGDHYLEPIGEENFKMLGRKIYASLSERAVQDSVMEDVRTWLRKIDGCHLGGAKKAWLYEHSVLAQLTWPFTVYDFCVTFVDELTAVCTASLKRWLGLSKNAAPEVLYLSKARHGLGLREVRVFFRQMQVVRASLVKYSLDPRMVQLYVGMVARDKDAKRWKATKRLEKAERDIALDAVAGVGNKGKAGLGLFPRKAVPAPGTHGARKEVSRRIAADADHLRRVHMMGLAMQGELSQWDHLAAQDLSWNRLLYELSPSLLKFALNARVNMLPTPDNLHRWGYGDHACKLCGQRRVTSAHILNGCPTALFQNRYTWRHNQVLAVLYDAVLHKANAARRAALPSAPSPVRFHRAGEPVPPCRRRETVRTLDQAADWRVSCDLPHLHYQFPVDAAVTAKRPDIVVWSDTAKRVVMLELTVPNEKRMVESAALKQERYAELAQECRTASYDTTVLTVEVGARGFVHAQTVIALRQLGIWSRKLDTGLSHAALRSSYAIYLCRNDPVWSWDVAINGVSDDAAPSLKE